jgi:GNAT superfamily N-acetyltransferase
MNVVPATGRAGLERFARLPFELYRHDTNWVPPLVSAELKTLDPKRNPFWRHAEAAHFLAVENGRDVGRISAIHNRAHNEFHGDRTGFFGWFECVNDPAVSGALFESAEAWLRGRGLDRVRGPVNPSMNDPCGLLVDGFHWSPFVLMTYNPKTYLRLLEAAGYAKAKDLLAFIITQSDLDMLRIDRVTAALQRRSKVAVRNLDLSRFEREIGILQDIYNSAWEKHWGFVPMTPEEVRFMAQEMRPVLLPEFSYVAELDGRPIGFAFALPDVNHALKKARGSLFPFGWRHFLKRNLRKIPTYRVVALGVRREHQHLGVASLFYQRFVTDGMARNYQAAEISWILEDNEQMIKPVRAMGAKPYKAYRIYEKAL